MPLSPEKVKEVAAALYKAEREQAPITPLTETYPDLDVADAYAIQQEGIRLRLASGGRIIGWKVGLTSKAMQQMFNVTSPDFGHLLDTMLIEDGATVSCAGLISPRIEPEVAFQINADLRGPGVTADQVLAATEYLIPALELIDSRIKDWKIKLGDTVSDNASSRGFVLGKKRTPPAGINLGLIGMNFYLNGDLVSTATSAAVLGNPAEAVAWMANTLAPYGQYLAAGQVIMPGSLVGALDAKPGAHIRAEFDHLEGVEIRFN